MSVGENKMELFLMIADSITNSFKNSDCPVAVTKHEAVVSNNVIETARITLCHQEEADDRMFLHVFELSKLSHKKVTIVTVDTDVVVIALYAFWYLEIEQLWVEFGQGKNQRARRRDMYRNICSIILN